MILSNCGCSPKNICRIFWWSSRKTFSRCSGGPTRKVPLTASPYFAQEDLKNRLFVLGHSRQQVQLWGR